MIVSKQTPGCTRSLSHWDIDSVMFDAVISPGLWFFFLFLFCVLSLYNSPLSSLFLTASF